MDVWQPFPTDFTDVFTYLRFSLIAVCILVSVIVISFFSFAGRRLVLKLCKYETRKQFFFVKLWTMSPDEVVSVSSVGSCKRHLDGFWCHRDLYHNYKADM